MFKKQKIEIKEKKFYPLKRHCDYNTEYILNSSCNEITIQEKEKRLKYFQNNILKDDDIKNIKIKDKELFITYKNNQIFRCKGYFVDNSIIIQK